jgi:hypothetical protein
MPDQVSVLYSEFLEGGYDCVDRVVLNAYFSMGQSGGGFRMWWRQLYGSDEHLDDNHLMRMAGRFSRRLPLGQRRTMFQSCTVRLGNVSMTSPRSISLLPK